jgi:hypothetical protein
MFSLCYGYCLDSIHLSFPQSSCVFSPSHCFAVPPETKGWGRPHRRDCNPFVSDGTTTPPPSPNQEFGQRRSRQISTGVERQNSRGTFANSRDLDPSRNNHRSSAGSHPNRHSEQRRAEACSSGLQRPAPVGYILSVQSDCIPDAMAVRGSSRFVDSYRPRQSSTQNLLSTRPPLRPIETY